MTAHINAGFVLTTEPVTLMDVRDTGASVMHYLSLFNPNGTTVAFIIRMAWTDTAAQERQVRLYDDDVGTLATWQLGMDTPTSTVLVLRNTEEMSDMRYEIVLDATPTLGLEYTVHFARES